MAIQFTRNGRKAMLWAQVEAMRRGDIYVEREHLLLGLLHGEETSALQLLARIGYAPEELRMRISGLLKPENGAARTESATLSPGAKQVVEQARRETESTGHDYVGTEHLLLALLHEAPASVESVGLSYEGVAQALSSGLAGALTEEFNPAPLVTPARLTPRASFLKGRHFLSVNDLSTEEIEQLFDLTREIKLGKAQNVASGKCAALLFEKPSLRTKLSFSVGMSRLGGQALYFAKEEVGLGHRESVKDAARVLSRMVDAIIIRTFDHRNIVELAHYASVPVINALTDLEHPCQALADFYTILEYRSETRGQKLVYIGDGCNTAISLMLLAPRLGTHFTLACPPGYEPPAPLIAQAQELAAWHGTTFEISHDPVAASNDADILYTDVWTSMGQENEKAKRLADFAGFQIGARTLREAKEDALILHCLPAHYGEEITEDAVDSPQSGIFDQAENRLHVQQALLAAVL